MKRKQGALRDRNRRIPLPRGRRRRRVAKFEEIPAAVDTASHHKSTSFSRSAAKERGIPPRTDKTKAEAKNETHKAHKRCNKHCKT